jgi:predicted  nucleic acid-binding Zn-ribbon protein
MKVSDFITCVLCYMVEPITVEDNDAVTTVAQLYELPIAVLCVVMWGVSMITVLLWLCGKKRKYNDSENTEMEKDKLGTMSSGNTGQGGCKPTGSQPQVKKTEEKKEAPWLKRYFQAAPYHPGHVQSETEDEDDEDDEDVFKDEEKELKSDETFDFPFHDSIFKFPRKDYERVGETRRSARRKMRGRKKRNKEKLSRLRKLVELGNKEIFDLKASLCESRDNTNYHRERENELRIIKSEKDKLETGVNKQVMHLEEVEKQWQTFDSIKDETDRTIQMVEEEKQNMDYIDVGYFLGESQGMIDMIDHKDNKRLRDAKKELTHRIHQTLEMLINWAMEKERRNSQESSRYKLEEELMEMREKLEDIEEVKRDMGHERDGLYEDTIAMRANIESLKEELEIKRQKLFQAEGEIRSLQGERDELKWLLKEGDAYLESYSEVIMNQFKAAQEELEIKRQKLSQAEGEIRSLQGERDDLRDNIEGFKEEIEALRKEALKRGMAEQDLKWMLEEKEVREEALGKAFEKEMVEKEMTKKALKEMERLLKEREMQSERHSEALEEEIRSLKGRYFPPPINIEDGGAIKDGYVNENLVDNGATAIVEDMHGDDTDVEITKRFEDYESGENSPRGVIMDENKMKEDFGILMFAVMLMKTFQGRSDRREKSEDRLVDNMARDTIKGRALANGSMIKDKEDGKEDDGTGDVKRFLNNIKKVDIKTEKDDEDKEKLNLRPVWAEEKEDMYPQFDTQRITSVVKKMEELNPLKPMVDLDIPYVNDIMTNNNQVASVIVPPSDKKIKNKMDSNKFIMKSMKVNKVEVKVMVDTEMSPSGESGIINDKLVNLKILTSFTFMEDLRYIEATEAIFADTQNQQCPTNDGSEIMNYGPWKQYVMDHGGRIRPPEAMLWTTRSCIMNQKKQCYGPPEVVIWIIRSYVIDPGCANQLTQFSSCFAEPGLRMLRLERSVSERK